MLALRVQEMTDLTHCGHGKSIREGCPECETVWGHSFMTDEQKQLAKFYGVNTKNELIAAQAMHVEKLQAKLPSTDSGKPQRVREG